MTRQLDDLMDSLVADYSDQLGRGVVSPLEDYLEQVPAEHRDSLERCLKMIEAGLSRVSPGATPLAPGVELDGFRLERELGRGGMAVVWLAEEIDLRRTVALKILRPGLAVDGRHVDRLRREALAVARLDHPHILRVYRVGEAQGHHYIATEYVDGPTLAEVLEQVGGSGVRSATGLYLAVGMPENQRVHDTFEAAFVALLVPVARALAVAHEVGIVHRDLKPSNILIRRDGRLVIGDFGLAKAETDPDLSLTGEVLGTPFYMSPEQVSRAASQVDFRTDVYSLGVTLYEGLSGKRPFEGDTVYQLFEAITTRTPPSLRSIHRQITSDADSVVRRAMARERDERYSNAMDLAVDLDLLSQGRPTHARAEEGGTLRQLRAALRRASYGEGIDFRSTTTFLGIPLVHVHSGKPKPGKRRCVARGWIAFGDVAIGGLAVGGVALGGVTFGGCAVGLLAAVGGAALGGVAIGGVAIGGIATGGLAVGYLALGGIAVGAHVVWGTVRDPVAVDFFGRWMPCLRLYLGR